MALKPIIEEISEDIKDVLTTSFSYAATTTVPNSKDSSLTFERGTVKRGKEIETCVLYVDIRNSVRLTATKSSQTIGKLYTAFIKAVIKIGRHHHASTRNIIGDRVMLVFPSENCFVNALNCAISINHLVRNELNVQFTTLDFKCGIGIDYGVLKVIKVGIQRNGLEQAENKGLVWAGSPANLASRLTDLGSKTITNTYYEVTYNALTSPLLAALMASSRVRPSALGAPRSTPGKYSLNPITKNMSESEFAASMSVNTGGTIEFTKGKLISANRQTKTITYPPILFTQRVYDGLARATPPQDLKYWRKTNEPIKDLDCDVYGGNTFWKL